MSCTSLISSLTLCVCVCVDDAFKALGIPPVPADKGVVTAILNNHVIADVAADAAAVISNGDKCYTTLSKK